ncbi:MAG: hypothetical protein WC427_01750 [Candidatus Paceibacterota bacterium]|jgi:uncharacterized membrane protein YciS (DUF1049 family)
MLPIISLVIAAVCLIFAIIFIGGFALLGLFYLHYRLENWYNQWKGESQKKAE